MKSSGDGRSTSPPPKIARNRSANTSSNTNTGTSSTSTGGSLLDELEMDGKKVGRPGRPNPKESNESRGKPSPRPRAAPKKEYSKLDNATAEREDDVELSDIEIGSGGSEPKDLHEKADHVGLEHRRGGDISKEKEVHQPAPDGKKRVESQSKNRFKGANPLQYGLWAHYLAIGAALMCICMGAFAILWDDARTYNCRVGGELIASKYRYLSNGQCPTVYETPSGEVKNICCDPDAKSSLKGYPEIGLFYILYGIFILFYENTSWGFGLWFPNDTFLFRNKITIIGVLHALIGIVGLYNYATCLAGACLFVTGVVYFKAVHRFEAGDGGREARRKAAEAAKAKREKELSDKTQSQRITETVQYVASFNPVTFCKRIYDEDKMSSYIWIGLYAALNLALFIYTLDVWYEVVESMRQGLLDGTLDVTCSDLLCHVYRKAVKFGPVSFYAPWAKACGNCLNLNCALLLLPVVRLLLRKINNIGESFSMQQHSNDLFSRFFAHPMTRYIPLQKNIEFHKICAVAIFFYAWGHMVFHWLNLWIANEVTLRLFRFGRWDVTDYLTGAIVTFAMFFIYTAAPDVVRLSKYEIFFKSHHMFTIFYLAMFLHGPVFFYWTCVPVLLYLLERYLQTKRGNRPYLILKVEYIPPVMAIYFRPVFKEHFIFKEGQYLYLNCPAISPSEWHPFTISSASDDMNNNTRIHLETGEEVVEIPRPKSLPPNAKWNKYCLVSQDWTTMDPNEYLDKSDTGFFDYISLHVKVHGLDEPTPRTWTRRLKEYIELMSPGRKFPFYFQRRDQRGEIQMGRQYGPDGQTPIIRVDGPHSAPAEHYARYGTLMLIGAGIGLTPCVSILTSLTKYRWKKNFNPELLHFYWIIRQSEVESFQWLVHMLTELSYDLKRSRAANQIERRYYCEINIYVTGVEKGVTKDPQPLYRPKRKFNPALSNVQPSFNADDLYQQMVNPTVDSRGQIGKMKVTNAMNRFQDIWVWNGRPHWDEIFNEMKAQRQHSDIGVCFCGAPAIGADLRTMCEKYSSAADDCLFSLHKENF
jgi:hypothetical protein